MASPSASMSGWSSDLNSMPIPASLAPIGSADELLTYLRDDLGWPVDGDPGIDFYDEPELVQDIPAVAAAQ